MFKDFSLPLRILCKYTMKHDHIYPPFPHQTAPMTPHHALLPILCLFFVNNPQNPITATHICMNVWLYTGARGTYQWS